MTGPIEPPAPQTAEGQPALPLTGRARVRLLLIEPLVAEGLQRPRGHQHTADSHAAFLDRLQDRLAYLDPANLEVLRHVILRLAEGPFMNTWPAMATILNNAHRLAPPPDAPIVASWLASVEGPQAAAAGHLVELHAFLVRHGRPPLAWDLDRIRDDARDNGQRCERSRERLAAGRDLSADDAGWLAAYDRRLAACQALVQGGVARRAAAVRP